MGIHYTTPPLPRLSLVGAGPGDPDLITRKGLKALQTADVLLYDALVAKALLAEAPASAIRLFVGKRAGCHYKTQEEINALIVQMARLHGHVVRLKGGDPFVFGRGYEEQTYAEAHGLSVEVIPGISSATSLTTLAGVPLTSRGYADSFWVLTAHTRSGQLSQDMQLAAQSQATVVLLMGLGKLRGIGQLYRQIGRGDLPAMVIQNGSLPTEKIWLGEVSQLAESVEKDKDKGPAIIVLGAVVALHPAFVKEKALAEVGELALL